MYISGVTIKDYLYPAATATPYAASFNGSSQYLSVATGQGINNFGTGNFTVESWIYFTAVQAGQIVSAGDGSNTNAYYWQYYGSQLQFGNQNVGSITTYNWTPTTNTWYHVAVVRSGTTVTQYINGTSVSSATSNISFVDGPTYIAFGGGGYFNGRISNVRIIKGTALYTSNFAVPSSPLTAIAGTQLLTCNAATLVDGSTNAFTITNNGSVTTTSATVPSFAGYSNSFNGTNQYLTAGTNSNWTFLNNGSSNFTVECWFNVPSTSTPYTLLATAAATANIGIVISVNDSSAGDATVQIDKGTPGSLALWVKDLVGNKFSANTWNHLAAVFNSSTSVCTIYMNGISILTATGSNFPSSAPTYTLAIGRYQYSAPGGYVNGYISNLRITNTIVYTGNFTPPTSQLQNISGTQLLTCNESTIVDNSSNGYAITNNNGVTVSTSTIPFTLATTPTAVGTGGIVVYERPYVLPITTFTLSALLVGGGGGGGADHGGGGGGGAFILSAYNITPGVSYTVIIGQGGSGGSNYNAGLSGGATVFNNVSAVGGGGGVGSNAAPYYLGTPGNSFAGAGGVNAYTSSGAGSNGGNGGAGTTSNITGTSLSYSSGGGGGPWGGSAGAAGGPEAGGGAGGTALANRGGGGGGGQTNNGTGANGGSGVVFLASSYVAAVSSLSGSPTITTITTSTNYSGSFNGSSQYLTAPNSANLTLGSNNFTIESWAYVPGVTSGDPVLFYINGNSSGYAAIRFGLSSSGMYLLASTNGSSWQINTGSFMSVTLNTWYHIAVTRSGSSIYVFVNGTQISGSPFTVSGSLYTGTLNLIGAYTSPTTYYFNGYISNLRITNTAVYTGAFTPSTGPLSAITGTQLLTLQNATITDTSTNALTITNNGSVTTTSLIQPFASTITGYAYTFNNNGYLTYTNNTFLNYAASFNGSNQYTSVGTNSNWTFLNDGTTNYTAEAWIYPTSFSTGGPSIVSTAIYGSQIGIAFGHSDYNNGDIYLSISGSGGINLWATSNNFISLNTWSHVAVVFIPSGSNPANATVNFYVNGVLASNTLKASTRTYYVTSAPTNTLTVAAGFGSTNYYYPGYISNVRIANRSLYTSNFTPPTTHLTAVSGTQLLTCQNAALVDNSTNNFTITNNNTVTTTYTAVPFNY